MNKTTSDGIIYHLVLSSHRYGHTQTVQYLLMERHADPNHTDKHGNTPLHVACR